MKNWFGTVNIRRIALMVVLLSVFRTSGTSAELDELQTQFQELGADIFTSFRNLEERYLEELNKLEAAASENAQLELVLEIQQEKENFRDRKGQVFELSEDSGLSRLQSIFLAESEKLAAKCDRDLATLEQGYLKQLTDLKAQLTRARKIEEATKVQEEIARIARPVGRFVRIDLQRTDFLHLAEVQVFSGAKNAAMDGAASQSKTQPGNPAGLAIDGNVDGDMANGSVSHTLGSKPWWEVDLNHEMRIEKIVIWNRTDGNLQGRLNGFKLSILDKDREVVWENIYPKAPRRELEIPFGGYRGLND